MRKALDYIETYHRENRIMPNLEEIRLALGPPDDPARIVWLSG
jgi:hypothetical protein